METQTSHTTHEGRFTPMVLTESRYFPYRVLFVYMPLTWGLFIYVCSVIRSDTLPTMTRGKNCSVYHKYSYNNNLFFKGAVKLKNKTLSYNFREEENKITLLFLEYPTFMCILFYQVCTNIYALKFIENPMDGHFNHWC